MGSEWKRRLLGTQRHGRTTGLTLAGLLVILLAPSSSLAEPLEPSHLLREVGHVQPGTRCEAVWGYRDHAYVQCIEGIIVVDISNPQTPIQIATWPGGSPIVHDDLLFTCNDVVDVSTPTDPKHLTTLVHSGSCHNTSFDAATKQLYLTFPGAETMAYDFSAYDPAAPPQELYPARTWGGGAHDVTAYAAYVYTIDQNNGGVYDALRGHDKLGDVPLRCYGVGLSHSIWPSQDTRFAVKTCEGESQDANAVLTAAQMGALPLSCLLDPQDCVAQAGAFLYELDFTETGVNFTLRDRFFLPPAVAGSAHKPRIMDRYAYIAFYEAGLQVLQIHEHTAQFRFAGNFDTSELDPASLSGAFDVYPYLGIDRLLVVDAETGLWILEHTTLEQLAAYMAVL